MKCTNCGSTEGVEWELAYVWRHDRTKTIGSRTVDAARTVEPRELRCTACISLLRLGISSTGQQRIDL